MNRSNPHRTAIHLFLAAAVLALVTPASAQEEITGIVEPVSARDHLRGPCTASGKLIEFGDTYRRYAARTPAFVLRLRSGKQVGRTR